MALWASYWTAVYASPSDRHSTYRRPGANSTSIGMQLSPRIRDLGRITLYRPGSRAEAEARFPHAGPLLTRRPSLDLVFPLLAKTDRMAHLRYSPAIRQVWDRSGCAWKIDREGMGGSP